MKRILPLVLRISMSLVLVAVMHLPVYAALNRELILPPTNVSFVPNTFLEGRSVRIYANVENPGSQDALGWVRFFLNDNTPIGDAQRVSVVAQKSDTVFVDFVPPSHGAFRIRILVVPDNVAEDDPGNNSVTTDLFVQQDSDRDGSPNAVDLDDDNDGVPDSEDAFPLNFNESLDTDGDGVGDNADLDADGDGVPNSDDDLPQDASETTDTDGDGVGDNSDPDIDGDGLTNEQETSGRPTPTNPRVADTDKDGVNDGDDIFPNDSTESADFDKDGIGNNRDTDDDNDSVPDVDDPFPLNKGPFIILPAVPKTGVPGELIIYDARPSFDEDGNITEYVWRIIDENGEIVEVIESALMEYRFINPGDYQVNLFTRDDTGEVREASFHIRIFETHPSIISMLVLMLIFLAIILIFTYSNPRKSRK
jgi:hypothetical protein